MTNKKIRSVLKNHPICFIRFEKKNGDIRNMICTINNNMIPANKKPKGVMDYDHGNQIRVFDIVANDWRSMLVDNVIEVQEYSAAVAPRNDRQKALDRIFELDQEMGLI
jgi:hypothetical protein